MSLMGIDIGTTGCKASVFSEDGRELATAYREYEVLRPAPGHAELDPGAVWPAVKDVIRESAAGAAADPVTALCASSLGEAVVPVTNAREVLGASLLNFDDRGAEYAGALPAAFSRERLFPRNGNTPGNHYSLTKLMWTRDHAPRTYEQADWFLHWAPFVCFMLGADPVVDYSLANRTLLFDLEQEDWSDELAAAAGLDTGKLPRTAPSGTVIGTVAPQLAAELGLAADVQIVTGAHDQCANGVGCGVLRSGQAMLGMGTYFCAMPVYKERNHPGEMMALGLNTEHHAAAGSFVSFIYNHGGSLLKWHRDTFAAAERDAARERGEDIYARLVAETPDEPTDVLVLPHFAPTGPPEFVADSSGVMTGLRLETTRGEVLKGLFQGAMFYLCEVMADLPQAGVEIGEFRAVGGGSKSDRWLQTAADILGLPLTRTEMAESGALGGAILAGTATGVFASLEEGVSAMVRLGGTFEPNTARQLRYAELMERYSRIWPMMRDFLQQGG